MADSDDEGGQSENKKDDHLPSVRGKPFSTMHQEIENKLSKTPTSYADRVSIVLSGWDHLAGTASHGQDEFASLLHRWTLQLVLQGEWPKLEKIVKTRLRATLQRCCGDPTLKDRCRVLLPLVSDPWGNPILKAIIGGIDISDEDAEKYVEEETWEVVKVRVDTMVESRCEELALSVLKVCMRCIQLRSSRNPEFELYSKQDHNHFVDLFFVLLYKYERNKFREELKNKELEEGIDFVRRLLAQQEKAKVWKHRLKIAENAIQIFLTSCIVKPYGNDFWSVFTVWCDVILAIEITNDHLVQMVQKLMQLAESSQHIYTMASIFQHKLQEGHAAMVTELLIRALTLDMNSLERVKYDTGATKDEQVALEHQMAAGFMDLATVFDRHESVSRECVLTAFSLHPTLIRLEKLKQFAQDSTASDVPSTLPNFQDHTNNEISGSDVMTSESKIIPQCDVRTSENETLSKGTSDIYAKDNYLLEPKPPEIITDTGQINSHSDKFGCQDLTKTVSNESNFMSLIKEECLSPYGESQPSEYMLSTAQYDSSFTYEDSLTQQSPAHHFTTSENELVDFKDLPDGAGEKDKTVYEDSYSDVKIKDEVDSMDVFLATTEGLIKQLHKESPSFDILSAPQAILNEEQLGITKELCDDMAVVLSSPRWQVLSWMLCKEELLGICEKYMKDSDSAKNLTKELKYLNIDYNLFRHLPSDESDSYTGIEKGYEHFIEEDSDQEVICDSFPYQYSSGSDGDYLKRRGCRTRGRRGRPPLKSRHFASDSDSAGYSRGRNWTTTSISDSDSDFDAFRTFGIKKEKGFEGKRVTAVSSNDRCKRLKVDAATGRVRASKGHTNLLRLYRHNVHSTLPTSEASRNLAPSLGSVNLNQSVILSQQEKPATYQTPHTYAGVQCKQEILSPIKREPLNFQQQSKKEPHPLQLSKPLSMVKTEPNKRICPVPESRIRTISQLQEDNKERNWKYSGYLVSNSNIMNPTRSQPTVPNSPVNPMAVRCSYRTKEGRVVNLNTHGLTEQYNKSPAIADELLAKVKGLRSPSKFEESFAKFLMQQNAQIKGGKKPSVTITRKPINLKTSLDFLKRQGTSVTYRQNDSTTELANAQKDVLNRIMSPENSRHGVTPSQLPYRAIAMPVSHNPPNLSPDKNSPANLSRVLPKGTTVVRRPKSDPGAGPSGLNNGGAGMSVIRNQLTRPVPSRPAVSITPSSTFLISNSSENYVSNSLPVRSNFIRTSSHSSPSMQEDATSPQRETFQAFTGPSPPLTSATVVGSVSQILSSRLNSLSNSPREIQGGSSVQTREVALASGRAVSFNTLSQDNNAPTTTTVATLMGEPRAPSMLETLLRDRSPTSPIVPMGTGGSALTNTTSALPDTLVAPSPVSTGVSNSSSLSNLSEAINLVSSHSSLPVSIGCNVISTPTSPSSVVFSDTDNRSLVVNSGGNLGSMPNSSLLGVNSMGVPVIGHNLSSRVLSSSLSGSGVGSGVITQVSGSAPVTSVSSPSNVNSSGMHQVLLPAQLIQVQGSDGSTGLGIVHSGSLDLRLPPGTRVIKSANSNVRAATPVAISQPNSRQMNLLHNVKIVQNRQIVRTVVVPHSVALQGLGSQQATQLVAITQSSGSNSSGIEIPSTSRIKPSQLHKMLGTNVPGGLVIRAVRPQATSSDVILDEANSIKPLIQPAHIHHTSQAVGPDEKDKDIEKPKIIQTPAQEEGLGERLTRHYLKAALLTTAQSTQSVGTQTQTTAVKPVTGPIVNQVLMNPLRGIAGSTLSTLSASSNVNTLSLTQSNAVSSETLEQLREFESVFEKVSNKSGKDSEADTSQQAFNSSSISSEESMIAAQLLSMANETPVVTSGANFVASVNTSTTAPESDPSPIVTASPPIATNAANSSGGVGSHLNENTFITIPSTTQAGTLILVTPSVATSGLVTMAGSNAPPSQPPPPASPALSSTSSHSSVASSPSSTSSKTKKQSSKPKVSPTTPSPSKPKSPPPPKAPPKPTVAKPQVEESDETKARIQAILDKYKLDLANNPQPQPAPRNRKNCPPPKSEGKSSSKKKGQVKKSDGGPSPSPQASDSGLLHSLSASPAPLSASGIGEDSEGSACSSSLSGTPFLDEKPKPEDASSSQILQGVVVSNVKVDSSTLSPTVSTLPAGLAGGRVFQLIRHGNKVTAITTQQPYSKVKAGLTQGGPPPNVTIQGRINLSDLMETHIASLLAGNSNINQSSSLIGKLLQSQQLQSSNVQQVVIQTSGQDGQPVVQQLSLQPILTANAKAQMSNQSNSTACNIGEPNSPLLNSSIKAAASLRASPSLPAGVLASPGTPHHRPVSPQTPSTPSPFPSQEDDSNSSEQSNESSPTGPLPPFFTLTKQFMIPSQGRQFTEKPLAEGFSRSASSQSSGLSTDHVQKGECSIESPNPGSSHIQSSSSYNDSILLGKNKPLNAEDSDVEDTIDESNMLIHSNPNSPGMMVKVRDNILDLSPSSCPSSLENSPAIGSHRVLSHGGASSDIRSNSMDSVQSDLSVEEVQIPPSPATLTKQLQNAYMTEAALSPVVSQAHLSSNSSFSSPATVQDLHFVDSHGEHRDLSPGIGSTSLSYTLAGATSRVTSTLGRICHGTGLSSGGGLEGSALACLSSGDVYLDQAGVGLGLDSLPLEEGRNQSPSLSDLVPAVPLLSWSPRSADSLMGQSPSLNEALTSNIALDVHPSEDSLCDSSTGFPALFSIEGDGASVSSSTSEDLPCNTPKLTNCTSVNLFSTPASSAPSPLTVHSEPSSSRRTYSRISKEGCAYNREQDHTVSSTHSEELGEEQADSLGLPEIASSSGNCNYSHIMVNSPATSDNNWRFDVSDGNKSSDVEAESKDEDSKDFLDHFKRGKKKRHSESSAKDTKESSFDSRQRRRSQRQMDVIEKKTRDNKMNMTHNGYEKQEEELNSGEQCSDADVLRSKKYSPRSPSPTCGRSAHVKTEGTDDVLANLLNDDDKTFEKQKISDFKKEPKQEVEEPSARITRGLKRRSEGTPAQDDKKVKSNGSENEVKMDDDAKSPYEDADVAPLKSLRNRNISGTSDSSSNYSFDRVSTPTLLDSPLGCGSGASSSRRRRRRLSHDSSVSSRDGSPLTLIQTVQHHDPSFSSSAGVNTRRASSRDHAKKTRCACCTDPQQQTSQSSSSRRSSGRVSRGSGPSSS